MKIELNKKQIIFICIGAVSILTASGIAVGTADFKKDLDIVAPSSNVLIYNGEEQPLILQGSTNDGVIEYALGDENEPKCDYSINIPKAKDAGTYYVWYKVKGDANHNDSNPVCISVNIAKAASTATVTPKSNLTYNGTAKELVTYSSTGGTLQYKLDDGNYSSTVPSATNAKDYTIKYKVVENENYTGLDEATIYVTISKATPTVYVSAISNLTYNNNDQNLVTGSTSGGTLQYKLGSTYSTSIPQGKNAGDYTVYYKVVGNSNYSDVQEQSIVCKINKQTQNAPSGSFEYIYKGSTTISVSTNYTIAPGVGSTKVYLVRDLYVGSSPSLFNPFGNANAIIQDYVAGSPVEFTGLTGRTGYYCYIVYSGDNNTLASYTLGVSEPITTNK